MEESTTPQHFIREIIAKDIAEGKHGGKVVTRFPPEPSGYLHIGHAKAICLDFGMAKEFGGVCHLRFDDTNPVKEEAEYEESIKEDIRWLGFDWGENLFYASDYFDQLHAFAVQLIEAGKAYVCQLSQEEWRDYRGAPTEPGKESPYRNRSVDENLDLFARMTKGEFDEGSHVLRAKIDMSSPNLHLRDPAIYRILKVAHHRLGEKWSVYPMYDFAHSLSDAIEGITHSLCTLEFEVHRPLYDWAIEQVEAFPSKQYEFARLELGYTIVGKRYLKELVDRGLVSGWDDPRISTLAGFRRRGYTPESIRNFCETVGVTKFKSLTDIALLEHSIREDLNTKAPRVLGVLDPLKVVIENYPEDKEEFLEGINNPIDPEAGTREVPFCREIYVEREDFMEEAPKKFFRLTPGREVRLRYAYFVTCQEVIKNEQGEVVELRCTFDPETRGGNAPDGRKVKGTIHWVSARHGVSAEVRLYDRLFTKDVPLNEKDGTSWLDHVNSDSLEVVQAVVEPSVVLAKPGDSFQFERKGYFCVDLKDSTPEKPVFNRTVTLRDSWAKR
jgi:glutaminyl-tRNA synthetase